eukprot:gene33737-43599_t
MTTTAKVSPLFCIILWMCMGYTMVVFNKLVLTTWGFHYPFFLTLSHSLFGSIFTQILSRTTNLLPGVKEGKISNSDYFKKIVPMSVLFVVGVVLGNMAYKHLSLGYIQMVKAVTPVPLLLLNFLAGKEKPSWMQFSIVIMVSVGVIMASVGELNFSLVGFIIQFSAVMCDCFNKLLADIVLKDTVVDTLSMLYYTSPAATVCIAIGFFVFEWPVFNTELFTAQFTLILLVNGLWAFGLNISVLLLVSNTSSMVISLVGPIKDILLVISSVLIFGNSITALQVLGFSLTLTALYVYREFKNDPVKFRDSLLRSPSFAALLFPSKMSSSSSSGALNAHADDVVELQSLIEHDSAK